MSAPVAADWPRIFTTLLAGHDLSAGEAEAALTTILAGEASPAQIAAFVVGLRAKGESVAELTGMVRAMQAAATRLDLPPDTIDIVGMGGAPSRRRHAVNVSTMACFVAAAAGATVCKHGNRKASSTSGSFDLLEALGIEFDLTPAAIATCVRELGVGFAFARTFHPAMRFAAPVRADLGVPSVFNLLGPLSHPGRVTRQLIGVADAHLVPVMADVMRASGSTRLMVVHGHGDLDELALTGPSDIVELVDGELQAWTLDPAELGLTIVSEDDLKGGDAAANAAIAERVLGGEPGPHRDIVALNAAGGLLVAGAVDDMAAGLESAFAAIDSGEAADRLTRLRQLARELAR